MEDEIVNYETAVLAKEKGFDWKCRNYFDDREYCTFIKNGLGYYKNEYHKSNSQWKNTNNISAPTQSLLQRWLREKHNIHISVGTVYEDFSTWSYAIEKKEKGIIFGFRNDPVPYKTYEECLEKALLTALKMI